MVNGLIQLGPLSVAMNADWLQFYKFGVWDPLGCSSSSLDHGISAIHTIM